MSELSKEIDRKFLDVIDIEDGWQIETDTGWHPISTIMKTVPYDEWFLSLEDGYELYAADDHIVFDYNMNEIFMKNILPGDLIQTENGIKKVLEVYQTGKNESMYDIQVESQDHRYYSGGILSHNTTCAAAYLLWKAMFFKDTQILICANKMNQAQEIMDRIRFSYENMEQHNWIRTGIVEYNKGSISFDNGSSITSRATTKDAGRGLSITILYIDEFAFVPPRIAEEFWTAISPVLATGGSCIITSTPNNDEDQFAQLWHGANNFLDENGNEITGGIGRNKFHPILIPYYEHPDRDEKWAEDERQKLGDAKFLQEHACLSADTYVDVLIKGIGYKKTIKQLIDFLEI